MAECLHLLAVKLPGLGEGILKRWGLLSQVVCAVGDRKRTGKKGIRSVCLDEMMQISAHCQKKATIDTRNKPLKPKDTVEAHELHPIFP